MKKLIVYLLIPALLLQTAGCYSATNIMKEDLRYFEGTEEITLRTFDNEEYSTTCWKIADDTLQFFPNNSSDGSSLSTAGDSSLLPNGQKNLPLAEIKEVSYEELDKTATSIAIGTGVLVLAVVFIIASAIKPFEFPSKLK